MWKEYDEIYLGPQHEAENMLRKEREQQEKDEQNEYNGVNYEN